MNTKQKTQYEIDSHNATIAKWNAKGWDAWFVPTAWGWALCTVKRLDLPDEE